MQMRNVILLSIQIFLYNNEIATSSTPYPSSNTGSTSLRSLPDAYLKSLNIEVICKNDKVVEVNYALFKKFPFFAENFTDYEILTKQKFLLLSEFNADSLDLFLKIQGENISVDLLVEILSFDKKEELCDLYFILNKLESDLTEESFLAQISSGKFTNPVWKDIPEIKKCSKSELFKAFKTNGYLARLIITNIFQCTNDTSCENLSGKFTRTSEGFWEFVFSYLEYRPLVFVFGGFTICCECEFYSFEDISSGPFLNWCLKIKIKQNEGTGNDISNDVQAVIDLINKLDTRFSDFNSGIRFYISESGDACLLNSIRSFVKEKNDRRTKLAFKNFTGGSSFVDCFHLSLYTTVLVVKCGNGRGSDLNGMEIHFQKN